MPHIAIKMYPGRTEEVKKSLAKNTKEFLMKELNMEEKYISVSIEEIEKENWQKEVVEKTADTDLYEEANF